MQIRARAFIYHIQRSRRGRTPALRASERTYALAFRITWGGTTCRPRAPSESLFCPEFYTCVWDLYVVGGRGGGGGIRTLGC